LPLIDVSPLGRLAFAVCGLANLPLVDFRADPLILCLFSGQTPRPLVSIAAVQPSSHCVNHAVPFRPRLPILAHRSSSCSHLVAAAMPPTLISGTTSAAPISRMRVARRRPVGAEVVTGGVHLRVWAPARKRVAVVLESGDEVPLAAEPDGYFSALVRDLAAGARYRFRLDREEKTFPDPASRFQPEGPHEASEVIDPRSYRWRNVRWRGRSLKGAVISEIHIGTFTPEGTFAAAMHHLDDLADAGINVIEVMPLHEFAGNFGWGYDGVDLWAPLHTYGKPDDFRRFVDAAHDHGLAVILDVVYNHLGPDGSYLRNFTPDYFTDRYENDWGEAINFDGPNANGVREFFIHNAAHWIDEYHLDGLRLDATQSINDASERHIVHEIVRCAREAAADRALIIVGENEPQDVRFLDQYEVDALWNDDWHHSAMVALTGTIEAYYTDYRGSPQEFVSMARLGFLFQGQRYKWQKDRRGTPSRHISPERLVLYLQNHDQIANSARGERIHQIAAPGTTRAMTALLLLAPQTPMLFQGQEFGASAPFLYFADHDPELAAKVREGRRDFLQQFPSLTAFADSRAAPEDPQTFEACKLDWSERERNAAALSLHRDLIRIRSSDPTFSEQRIDALHGAVIADDAFVLRWMPGGDGDRLLIVNLGGDLHFDPAPEPLLAPPATYQWTLAWSSEWPEYGGGGHGEVESDENWKIPRHAAVVLRPA
jgi:maltooligosyltrehalose trehalohydrolase